MTKYSRDVFSKYSQDQLLNYIEQQNDQLGRFETRFRDVVQAYKGVLKEKEALESTVQALSATGSVKDQSVVGLDDQQTHSGGSECLTDNETDSEFVKGEGGEPVRSDLSEGGDASDSGAEGRRDKLATPTRDHLSPSGHSGSQLRQQLSTLTVAMATLTEEKSKMESNFQHDKKAMLTQHDSLSKLLHSERDSAKKENKQLQQKLEEVRDLLRSEQTSRLEEQETNAQMLRELQALIVTERDHKEALTLQLEELNEQLYNVREHVSKEKVHEYEELIQSMSIELEQVKGQLLVAVRQDPSPQILKLKQEMSARKDEHEQCLRKEQEKVLEAEERIKLQAQHEEERVASLEAKLSSLSETIGGYDRLRENDQATIQKLKERVVQLDSENTALTREHIEREDSTSAELTAQVSALQEKIARLKALIKLATVKINEKAILPVNLEELSVSDYADILSSQPSGKEYQQELSLLKEEFDRYKTRAQSVLKNRGGGKDVDSVTHELQELQRANSLLHSELDSLREQSEEEGEKYSLQLQRLRQEMRDMDTRHRKDTIEADTLYKNKLYELQTHVQTTRSRTLKLLEEKDTEIQKLRAELQTSGGRGTLYPGGDSPLATRRRQGLVSQGSTSSLQDESNGSVSEDTNDSRAALNLSIRSADSSSAVQELLDKSSPVSSLTSVVGERRLLHVVQEQQHRDNELAMARRKRLEVEDTNRDLLEREQRHFEQITFLKGEIRKLERDRSRETESMEYLKNVIMHYMCADSTGRDQMISPIATVLHFSPEEVSEVKKRITARRWLTAPPK